MSTPRCEACGRALASADAVCRCDESRAVRALGAAQNLDTQLARQEAAARFRCPACARRFNAVQLKMVSLPAAVPWYRPAISGQACPHCGAALLSRHLPALLQSRTLPLALLFIGVMQKPLLGLIGVGRGLAQAIAVGTMVAALCVLLYIGIVGAWRARKDENAYVRDPRFGSSPPA